MVHGQYSRQADVPDAPRPQQFADGLADTWSPVLARDEAADDANLLARDSPVDVKAVEAERAELLQHALVNPTFSRQRFPIVVEDPANHIQLRDISISQELRRVAQHVVDLGFDPRVAVGIQQAGPSQGCEGAEDLAGI
jgi:hypothetical protein